MMSMGHAGRSFRACFTGRFLDCGDAVEDGVKDRGGLLVHDGRIVALESEGLVAIAAHQVFKLGMGNAREHRGVGDLVAVEMEDGQHGAIGGGVEEFVGVPAGGEGAGFGFAIAYHAGHDEVGIVECRAIGMHQRIAQFAAFVDGAGVSGATWLGMP